MRRILQVFYIIFSAALLSLAIPNELYNFGSPLIGFIALIPFYFAYNNFESYKEAFLLSALHGLITHLLSSFWLAYFKEYAALTLGASAIGTGLIHGLVGWFYFLPYAKTKKTSTLRYNQKNYNISFKIIWFVSIYVLWEWVKSCGFLGYPWGTVSSAMYKFKILTQIADITGTYGITYICALFSAIIAQGILLTSEISKSANPKNIIFSYKTIATLFIALIITSFIYGTYQYYKPRKPIKYLSTIFVQQNSDPWKQSSDNESILLSQKLTEEKLQEVKNQGKSVDLVVWSEGCLKYSFPNSEAHYRYFPSEKPLLTFIKETNVPFLLGGSYKKNSIERKYMNAALLFDNNGKFRGAYGKNHLVPLAEAIPFSEIPFIGTILKKLVGISAGWDPGDQYVFFELKGHHPTDKILPLTKTISLKQSYSEQKKQESEKPYVKISAPICFDDSFPDVCIPLAKHGTELFVNITDDSWSQKKSSEYQHFVVSSYRAIETRTTMARSTNSGYSVVIDPTGKIIHDMPLFEATSSFFQIPVYQRKQTTYMTFVNWLPKIIIIFVLIVSTLVYINLNKPLEPNSERKIHKKKHKKNKK